MLTSVLIRLKHACPALWREVEGVNSRLMALRYPRLRDEAAAACSSMTFRPETEWSLVTPDDAGSLSAFLSSMPESRTAWFAPHPFDADTLRRMARGNSFVMFKVTHRGRITGYHFLRCFFTGKAFHGLIVADEMAGRGIGTHMWSLAADICQRLGLDMQATIHPDNIASLTSCRHGCDVTVISTLPNGYLQVKCRKKDRRLCF